IANCPTNGSGFSSCFGQPGCEPVLPATQCAGSAIPAPRLAFPTTNLHIFVGAQEPSPGIAAFTRQYYDAITSAKSFTTIPNTPHNPESTQEGVNAYVDAIRQTLG